MAESFTTIASKCCRAQIDLVDVPPGQMPPPPGALLGVGGTPPEEWKGQEWVCSACGAKVGVSYDYGTIDLGIVRDSQLVDVESYEIFAEDPPS